MTWDWSVSGSKRITFDWVVTQRKAGATLATTVTQRLREAAPVSSTKSDRGRLSDSIGPRQTTGVESGAGTYELMFISTAPYAEYVIRGTQAGATIKPRRTKSLRWNVGGATIFAHRVRRGATKANPFNQRVAAELTSTVLSAFKDATTIISTES